MHSDDQHRRQRFEHGEQQAEVQREVRSQEERFGQHTLCLSLDEKADALEMHAECLQKRQRKYQVSLVLHDEPRKPSLVESLVFFEGEQRDIYIGIDVYLIRMTVMLIVLVDPPLAAHAEQQVAEDQSSPVVLPRGVEGKLPMPTV